MDNDRGRDADLPLSGRSIVVTRAAEQAAALADRLEALGAEVLSLPVIEIAEPSDWTEADSSIDRISEYDWVVLTSANGVDRLDARMRLHGLRLSDLRDARIAVVGSATAARLREHGLEPSVTPEQFRAEGLADAMRDAGVGAGSHVLVARAEEAREVLPEELRALGAAVEVAPVYRLQTAVPAAETVERLAADGIDAIVFASGGTAKRFLEVLRTAGLDEPRVLDGAKVVSIGPVTSEALQALGIAVDAEAAAATAEALVEALVDLLSGAPR